MLNLLIIQLGSMITALRKQKEWSQSELARQVAVSKEMIGRCEQDDAIPSLNIAKRLAQVLGGILRLFGR
jgi:ribosome-binding protein aMBF1 (putative translation factor)